MGQKHKRFRESRTPFPLRDTRKNPRSMYARVPQAVAQFVLKIEKLSHIMGPTPILEMARAYSLRPRLWLLIWSNIKWNLLWLKLVGNTTRQLTTPKESPRLVAGLFVIRLLILHFKFQFTKSIKSSTFHISLNLTYPLWKKQNTQKFTQNRLTVVNVMSIEI